jgi:hypothetical protein
MPFSFPSSPSVGATSTQNGRSYTYAGNNVWELAASGGGSVVTAATVSAFPATGSSSGVIYVATDTARAYIWAGAYLEIGASGGGGSGDGTDATLRALFVPPAPTGLAVSGGNAQASLSWTAPTGVIAQAPITDYREQFSSDGGTNWTTFTAAESTAASTTVTGLTNGTAYVFRVAAVNAAGTGAYAPASSEVTPGVASAPTGLTATAGNAQIALAWTAPSNTGASSITGYRVEYTPSGGSAQTVSTGSTSTSYALTGLTNGTAYAVRVAAVNSAGVGAYTAASTATPSAAIFRAIPILTSATSSGVASASEILAGGLDAWRAFDKATVTGDNTFYAAPSPATGNWIQYDFGSGVSSNIGGYSITPRYLANYGDSGTGVSQAPVSWTLSGSNDGTNFTVIDTRNSPQSFSWGQARTFTLSSAAEYRVFRWTWTGTPAGGAVVVPKIQLVSA